MRKLNNKKQTIYYVDGLCGSGKTHGLGHFIQQSRLHQKFLITAPSKVLIDQILTQLTDLGIANCYKHYSTEDRSSNVPHQIMQSIQHINTLGQGVIICTQQVFPHIDFIENQSEWVLIVDEIPKVDIFQDPALPYNHSLLSQYVLIKEDVGIETYEVEFNDGTYRMGSEQDAINDVIKPVVDALMSEHYRCYTDRANWERLVTRNQVSEDSVNDVGYGNELNKLYFLSLLQPSIFEGFAQVIMMGANFEASMLFKYWTEYCDVVFIPHQVISQQLRYSQYSQGHRLTIQYLDEDNWSKHSASKVVNGKSKLDHFAALVAAEMADKPFIYMTNNNDATEFAKGIKAPVIAHGLNQYSHINSIYFSPALNNKPKHSKMLMDLGFDADFIKRAMSYEIAHQAIMRTSLRNPDSDAAVVAIVVDKGTAHSIAGLFPGCQVGPVAGCLKQVKAMTQTERNSKSRLQKLVALRELNSVVMDLANAVSNTNDEKDTWENLITKSPYIEISNQNRPDFLDVSMGVSFMSSIYNKSLASMNDSPMDFVSTMQGIFNNHIIRQKDESILFNGVRYKTEQSRALDNVDYASLVVVDIDNGDLSPDEFYRIFTQLHKHSFFMCNSFSRSADKPNNYRAIFFIDQVVNDDIYRDIQAYLQRIIEQQGYITCWPKDRQEHLAKNPNAKFSGIDLSKNHTASFFYIPCKVQGREEWAFFKRGNLKDLAQLKRYAIKVEKVIQHQPEVVTKPTLMFESNNAADQDWSIDREINHAEIIERIKTGNYKHLGAHRTYGEMAASMQSAGFTAADFVEITPYISQSKTAKDAHRVWRSWGKYQRINLGTLFHHLGFRK